MFGSGADSEKLARVVIHPANSKRVGADELIFLHRPAINGNTRTSGTRIGFGRAIGKSINAANRKIVNVISNDLLSGVASGVIVAFGAAERSFVRDFISKWDVIVVEVVIEKKGVDVAYALTVLSQIQ